MFIPKFVSVGLRVILANLDFGLKNEGTITNDLHEHFAMSPLCFDMMRGAFPGLSPEERLSIKKEMKDRCRQLPFFLKLAA